MTVLSEFCSHLGAINLLVFSLHIVSLDKQLYIELETNKYKCFVDLVWHCRGSVLVWVYCIVDLTIGVYLFLFFYDIYLTFRLPRSIIIYCSSIVDIGTAFSITHMTTARPNSVTYNTGLI